MKKILMIALIASFVTTASAERMGSSLNLLSKANLSNSTITGNNLNGFVGFCVSNCVNDNTYCVANETGPYALEGCALKYEVCLSKCANNTGF